MKLVRPLSGYTLYDQMLNEYNRKAIKMPIFLNILFHAPMRRFQLNQNWNYLYFQVSPSSHYIAVFVSVGLSSFLGHILQVLLGVEGYTVARPGYLTVGAQITGSFNC
jgi:hypothetical protein